ncbi:SAPLIP C protein [Dictyostelium discoideum AX4]|uniref:SAPLIP C protein n=1 Tax=Dictyostelium discoideum TaxID=44689 RepID=Q54LG2_DICDI|nr:SAPLIP C protein [Dictyostelium discoideum AX4]EAL64036.1 SAPLIP C protein [Dictyostelium discoideum AX4]|eukprot:XP_637599.1 SAPLIP C protein [Dictyostelium discoideum AX4]
MKYLKGLILALVALSSVNSLNIKDDAECMLCNVIVDEAEAYVAQNFNSTEISSILSENCQLLPSFQDVCIGIVDEYTPTIIKYIIAKESPTTICEQINCCDSSSSSSSSQDSSSSNNDSWSEFGSSSQDSSSFENNSSSDNSQSNTGASTGTSGHSL